MTEKMIIDAYCRIRTIDQSIPDEVLDFMKESSLEKLRKNTKPIYTSKKIEKAKDIIGEIYSLYNFKNDGVIQSMYGNWELNKATDAMYKYIKEIE